MFVKAQRAKNKILNSIYRCLLWQPLHPCSGLKQMEMGSFGSNKGLLKRAATDMASPSCPCDGGASSRCSSLDFGDSSAVWNTETEQESSHASHGNKISSDSVFNFNEIMCERKRTCNGQSTSFLGQQFQYPSIAKEFLLSAESMRSEAINSLGAGLIRMDDLFEEDHLEETSYDPLEDTWENIDKLSSLEDMENLFLDPLMQSNQCNLDANIKAECMSSESQCLFNNAFKFGVPVKTECSELLRSLPQGLDQCMLDSVGESTVLTSSSCAENLTVVKWKEIQDTAAKKTETPTAIKEDPDFLYSQVSSISKLSNSSKESTVSHKVNVQDPSCSTETEKSSVEASVLQKLQLALTQLDLKTRTCIRDALYRLARSSTQRHIVNQGKFTGSLHNDASNSFAASERPLPVKNLRNSMHSAETNTNLIDRTIMSLLFWKQGVDFLDSIPSNSQGSLLKQYQGDMKVENGLSGDALDLLE